MGGGNIPEKHGKKLTKAEELLIHLSKFEHHKDDYFVPIQVTEEGLQRELCCSRSLISSILRNYEKVGFIYRIKSKVDRKKYKQFAFFLTKSGRKHALRLKKATK